jgi:hypothetical protein
MHLLALARLRHGGHQMKSGRPLSTALKMMMYSIQKSMFLIMAV